jgi:SAM-dependent methyltransferase
MSRDESRSEPPVGLSKADRDAIIQRYAKRFEEFGVDLKTLDVGQHYDAQHVVHASIGDLNGKTLLDIGCGLGHYYEYLRARSIAVDYIGYDFMAPFIEADRERFPEATFEVRDVTNEEIVHAVDYVVMCQVFNNRYADCDNTEVVKAVIRKAFAAARIGISVDMLSSYVNFRVPEMHYFSPEEMFAFGRTLTPFIRLRHDYAPRHFTLFLYKDAVRT